MKYIEIVKAVREEQMKKEASVKKLAGLLKKANKLVGEQLNQSVPKKSLGQTAKMYRNRLQAISDRTKEKAPARARTAYVEDLIDSANSIGQQMNRDSFIVDNKTLLSYPNKVKNFYSKLFSKNKTTS